MTNCGAEITALQRSTAPHSSKCIAQHSTAHLGQLGGDIEDSALAISSQAHALHFLHCGLGRHVLLQESEHQPWPLNLGGRGEHEGGEIFMSCQKGPGLQHMQNILGENIGEA